MTKRGVILCSAKVNATMSAKSIFIFIFILKFFKEGNPSANMLVFKGPSN